MADDNQNPNAPAAGQNPPPQDPPKQDQPKGRAGRQVTLRDVARKVLISQRDLQAHFRKGKDRIPIPKDRRIILNVPFPVKKRSKDNKVAWETVFQIRSCVLYAINEQAGIGLICTVDTRGPGRDGVKMPLDTPLSTFPPEEL